MTDESTKGNETNQEENGDKNDLSKMAKQVQERAASLTADTGPLPPLDDEFVGLCLKNIERGDGFIFSAIHQDKFIMNTTPKDDEWYTWADHVWEKDKKRKAVNAVEDCAFEYQRQVERLKNEIDEEGIDKKHADAWKLKLRDKYQSRCDRLRTKIGTTNTLYFAPIVNDTMACSEADFDKQPWLLPVQNGVIDLRTGALTNGKPEHLLTRCLDIEYDPHADYTPWLKFLNEISDDEEIVAFLKRTFGYAITGLTREQYIWVFTGPGRNGKGTLFSLIGEILGSAYYHELSEGFLLEQRNEPGPAATSEHKYSLLGKRIIVGAETNKGKKINVTAVKALTGEDDITCRPLFGQEISFKPSHAIFLHTNHLPIGLTSDFAISQRLLKVEFPYMYVDDIEAEAKKKPHLAARFRLKDPLLKEKLREHKQGILRWLVEGCLEWQAMGLKPPQSIIDGVTELAKAEDYIGSFMEDCLTNYPDQEHTRISCSAMYDYFQWWWVQNMDARADRTPALKTINKELRERGHSVEKSGGKFWLYRFSSNPEVEADVLEFINKRGGKS